MLPPFIIEQIRQREERERRHAPQPFLELPVAPVGPPRDPRDVVSGDHRLRARFPTEKPQCCGWPSLPLTPPPSSAAAAGERGDPTVPTTTPASTDRDGFFVGRGMVAFAAPAETSTTGSPSFPCS